MIKRILLMLILSITATQAQEERNFGGNIEAEVDGKIINLPLLKSDIEAKIDGDIASVQITQTFANPSNKPMHAKYLFPMNKDSAVYAMTMIVGDDLTIAKIKKKDEAKRIFNKAKSDGKAASLLSQHRPNMFTQDIANLMPGLPIKVQIKYSQIVPKVDGNYELVVPLIVGPRYQPSTNALVDSNDDILYVSTERRDRMALEPDETFNVWEIEKLPNYPGVNGLTLPKTIDKERVSINVRLNSDINIQNVFSETHDISVSGNENGKDVILQKGRIIDNSDFVLKYQLSGAATQAGFLSVPETDGEGYFSLLIEPPEVPEPNQISKREMVFVLDTSGSMTGVPLEASKTFMRHALNNLRQDDTFRIISFNNIASEYSSSPQIASALNIKNGLNFVDNLNAGGGTEIAKSITQAFHALPDPEVLRIVVFLTDGYIGNEATVLNQISAKIGNARIYAFGVGTSVNRFLLSEMGRKGRGFARFIDPTENSNDAAISFATKLGTPVLTDISLDYGGLQIQETTPDNIPDLFAGDSIRIVGKYIGSGDHVIRVNGKVHGKKASLPVKIHLSDETEKDNGTISQIWARSMVADKMRQINTPDRLRTSQKTSSELKTEIINLGLTHSIVTQWTSFVAVSEKIINESPEKAVIADVPLPMVKGVTEKAYPAIARSLINNKGEVLTVVGSRIRGRTALDSSVPATMSTEQFSGASTPEPGALGGIVLLTLMGLFVLKRRKKH